MKKPKSEIKDEDSYEDLMKKVKKKGRTYKCYYCNKVLYLKNKCFNKKLEIMSQLLKKHNIEILDDLEKPAEFSEDFHSAQSQVNMNYSLSARVK